jgi:outer membrane lipoprotein SlyB
VGQTATMNLAFESISFGGQNYPLQASVERADVRQQTRTSAAEQAGKVAAGAAAGAILGQVIGRDRSSTIRGAVVGAAAGTAIAMGTADVDAVIPAGAEVIIRLDQPIEVTRTVAG